MTERWLPVVGLEGRYEVSDLGRIRSLNYRQQVGHVRCLKLQLCDGYLRVVLSAEDGSVVRKLVHRAVAEAFIPNPDSKPEVNHKYGLRQDNRVTELEWSTHAENAQHGFDVLGNRGLRGAEHHHAISYVATAPDGTEHTLKGLNAFCSERNLTHSAMVRVAQGSRNHHKGWHIRYAESLKETSHARMPL